MNNFQELIDYSHDMAYKLLLAQDGEFYPFAAKIDNDGKLTPVAIYSGDEFPLSQTMITEFKAHFDKEIKQNKIRAYAITFDCLAQRDSASDKTDAIGIECLSTENGQRATYYFPYKRALNDGFEFGESWKMPE